MNFVGSKHTRTWAIQEQKSKQQKSKESQNLRGSVKKKRPTSIIALELHCMSPALFWVIQIDSITP